MQDNLQRGTAGTRSTTYHHPITAALVSRPSHRLRTATPSAARTASLPSTTPKTRSATVTRAKSPSAARHSARTTRARTATNRWKALPVLNATPLGAPTTSAASSVSLSQCALI